MVNYARVHDQAITGMFLVWDYALPDWVVELAAAGDADGLGELYRAHIAELVTRYAGRIGAWVVVNEAIWGPDETGAEAAFAVTPWIDVLGVESIEWAFEIAREADPTAVLLYNETGAEALGPKADFVYAMAADFVAREVPIDGIGLQFHIDAAAPPDMADVRANFERFAALGLEIHITELDVAIDALDGGDALERQAAIYVDVLETCLAVPACTRYGVFGFTDRYGWDELGDAAPLLLDDDYRPKPAYRALQAALESPPAS
jgi:endo-1,4-beta-xylanase